MQRDYSLGCEFSFEILKTVEDASLLDNYEKAFIAYYNTFYEGYNHTPGGEYDTRFIPDIINEFRLPYKNYKEIEWVKCPNCDLDIMKNLRYCPKCNFSLEDISNFKTGEYNEDLHCHIYLNNYDDDYMNYSFEDFIKNPYEKRNYEKNINLFRYLSREIQNDENFEDSDELFAIHSSDFDNDYDFDDLGEKYYFKSKGIELEKLEDYCEAIEFYNDLKKNSLFINDYYPYKRLTILYEKINDAEANLENISSLFKNKIYCNDYHLIWFKNKLNSLSIENVRKIQELESEIAIYENFKQSPNTSMPIADRIFCFEGIRLLSQEKYDFLQDFSKINLLGNELIRQGKYEDAIEHYLNISQSDIPYFKYYSYRKLENIYKKLVRENVSSKPREYEAPIDLDGLNLDENIAIEDKQKIREEYAYIKDYVDKDLFINKFNEIKQENQAIAFLNDLDFLELTLKNLRYF